MLVCMVFHSKVKISVCRIYSKISKDRLRRVGGLFLCLEIFEAVKNLVSLESKSF